MVRDGQLVANAEVATVGLRLNRRCVEAMAVWKARWVCRNRVRDRVCRLVAVVPQFCYVVRCRVAARVPRRSMLSMLRVL